LNRQIHYQAIADTFWSEPNPNGCWDWWGYLDAGWPDEQRYVTRKGPQMQVMNESSPKSPGRSGSLA
jgi:hypothetical protein